MNRQDWQVRVIAPLLGAAALFGVALPATAPVAEAAFEGRPGGIVYEHEFGTFRDGNILFSGGIYFKRSRARPEVRLTDNINDADPSFSPDGGKIAFARSTGPDGQGASTIFIIKTDGSGLRPVTSGPGYVADPSFSPDGEWIYFTGSPDSGFARSDIYRVPVSGGEALRLTSAAGKDTEPAVSPDGRRVAFTTTRRRGDKNVSDIFVMQADGAAQRPLVDGSAKEISPSFSPDGKLLTFVRDGRVVLSRSSRGAPARILTTRPDSNCRGGSRCFTPTFSPDGRRVLYLEASEGFLIASVRLSGKRLRVYVQGGEDDDGVGDFAFSPDWQPLPAR